MTILVRFNDDTVSSFWDEHIKTKMLYDFERHPFLHRLVDIYC